MSDGLASIGRMLGFRREVLICRSSASIFRSASGPELFMTTWTTHKGNRSPMAFSERKSLLLRQTFFHSLLEASAPSTAQMGSRAVHTHSPDTRALYPTGISADTVPLLTCTVLGSVYCCKRRPIPRIFIYPPLPHQSGAANAA